MAKKKTSSSKRKTASRRPAGPRRVVPNPHWREIAKELQRLYPAAECALVHRNAFELLVATILSAQCTDERVNRVCETLFLDYPTPRDFAEASQEEIEEAIRSTGFFRNKARNIRAASRILVEEYDGQVPNDMEKLNALPGVGRKTANVVLGDVFDNPDGVVVDTHVKRLSYKLALTDETDPVKIERDLNALLPRRRWVKFGHELILHGRQVCRARSPRCDECTLYKWCPTRA